MSDARKLSAGEIDAIIAGCEGTTPGPWEGHSNTWSLLGDGMWFATVHWTVSCPRNSLDLAHIARLDPATVLALATLAIDGIRMRKALEERDNFIVAKALWQEFVDGLPKETHSGGTDE